MMIDDWYESSPKSPEMAGVFLGSEGVTPAMIISFSQERTLTDWLNPVLLTDLSVATLRLAEHRAHAEVGPRLRCRHHAGRGAGSP